MYQKLFERQEGICSICEEPLSELSHLNAIDHIIRRKDGGKWEEDNLRLIHLSCDWEREGNTPNSPYPEIATAYRTYKLFQKMRSVFSNTLLAYSGDKAGTTRSPYFNAEIIEDLERGLEKYRRKERDYFNLLGRTIKAHPIGSALIKGPGMAPITAAMLMSRIDITLAKSVSAVWKYFGFIPEEAAGQKGRNPGLGQLRAAFYAIPWATKALGKYEEYYRTKREADLNHGQAQQRTIKLWLSHVWDYWRRLEGLPNRSPYSQEHLQGHEYISPEEYGWPEVE